MKGFKILCVTVYNVMSEVREEPYKELSVLSLIQEYFSVMRIM